MPPKLIDLTPYSVPDKSIQDQWKILWRDTHHHVYIINIYTHYIVNAKESQCKKMDISVHIENRLLMQYLRDHCSDLPAYILDFDILETVAENMLLSIREKEAIYDDEDDLFYEVQMPLERLGKDLDSLRDDFFANIRHFDTEFRPKAPKVPKVPKAQAESKSPNVQDIKEDNIDDLIDDLYEISKKKKIPLSHRKKIKNLPPPEKEIILPVVAEEKESLVIVKCAEQITEEEIIEAENKVICDDVIEISTLSVKEETSVSVETSVTSIEEPEDYIEKYKKIYTNYSDYSLKELTQLALDISRENLDKVNRLVIVQEMNRMRQQELNDRIGRFKNDLEEFRINLENHNSKMRDLSESMKGTYGSL